MNYREQIYKASLKVIEQIYTDSKYDKDIDLYRSFDIINATNDAQMESKEWLVKELVPFLTPEYIEYGLNQILVLGSWYGITGMILRNHIDHDVVIRNVDSDPMCERLSWFLTSIDPMYENNRFNTCDAAEYYFDRTDHFQVIINTSCEHMDQEDIDLIIATKPKETIVCFQSNNFHKEPEHVNTHNSIEEFEQSLNLTRVFYSGTLKPSDEYERYMVIGI